jgi:hypothetical protein
MAIRTPLIIYVYLIGIWIGATATPARAGLVLSLTITEIGPSGSVSFDIPDNASPFDTNPGAGVIDVPTADLNGFLSEFQFVGPLTVSIGAVGTGPDATAALGLNGDVMRTSAAGQATLTLDAVAAGVSFPAAAPKILTASGSDTFISGGGSPSRTFQGFFNDQGTGVATLTPPSSNQQESRDVGNATVPYTLRYVTTLNMVPASGTGPRPEDRFTAAATVSAVPEPSSLTSAVTAVVAGAALCGFRRVTAGLVRARSAATPE